MTYTARDGIRDPDTLRRWQMLRLEQRPDVTSAERLAMRAERLGAAAPGELAARRARRLAGLAAGAEAGGLIPAAGGTGDPAAIDTVIRVHLSADDLSADDRPDYLVCQMCCRTLHKRNGRRVEVRPDVFCCPCCAGLAQEGPPAALDQWLLDHRRYKRAAIIVTYRTDPATLTAAEAHAEITRMYADAGGAPLAVTTARAMAAASLVPVRTYFALVRERGRGVL